MDCEDAMDYMVTRGCEGHMGCQGTTDNEDARDCEDAVDDEGVDTKDTKDAMDSQVATDHMDAKDCEDAATMYTLCGGGGRAAACDVAPVAPAGQRQRWTPMPATCASVRVTVHYIDAYTVTQCPVPSRACALALPGRLPVPFVSPAPSHGPVLPKLGDQLTTRTPQNSGHPLLCCPMVPSCARSPSGALPLPAPVLFARPRPPPAM